MVLLPWKQTRISNYGDGTGDSVTTTVYRPIFSPPRTALQPEIDLVRLGYQLMVTALVVWVLMRRTASTPASNIPAPGNPPVIR